jgi:hypothetical protein
MLISPVVQLRESGTSVRSKTARRWQEGFDRKVETFAKCPTLLFLVVENILSHIFQAHADQLLQIQFRILEIAFRLKLIYNHAAVAG